MKRLPQIILFNLLLSCSLFAQTDNIWNGDGDDYTWHDPTNWSEDVVPNEDHDVIIDVDSYIEIDFTASANSIYINHDDATLVIVEGTTLTIDDSDPSILKLDKGTVENYGDLNIQRFESKFNSPSTFTNYSGATLNVTFNGNDHNFDKIKMGYNTTFNNYGTINGDCNDDDLDIIFCDGTFTNEGTLNLTGEFSRGLAIYSNGTFINETGAQVHGTRTDVGSNSASLIWCANEFENHGEITLEHTTDPNGTVQGIGISLSLNDTFENTGTINISNMGSWGIWFNGDFINSGTINIDSPVNKMIGNSYQFPRDFDNTSGEVNGSGIIQTHDQFVGGTINIGSSPGEITFQVSQDLSEISTPIEIAGTTGPGDINGHDVIYGDRQDAFFDLVDIELGDVDIDFFLLGGFQPVYGDEFLIVQTDGELTGQFGIIGFPALTDPNLFWEIDYDYSNDEVALIVNAFVVPVEMTAFNVYNREGMHELNWTTASEINSSHFEIQISTDSKEWESIGDIDAAGNSTAFNDYYFENRPNGNSENYFYRLKIIDLDGSFEYSEIRTIRDQFIEDLFAYPNPFKDEITISSTFGFSLFDSYGQIIHSTIETNIKLNLEDYPSGLYFVKYKNQKTQKLVKL